MKKVIVLFIAILAFAANTFAQSATQTETQKAPKTERGKGHRGGNGKHAGKMDMKKALNLSSDQSNSMKKIGNDYKGKMKALKTDETLSNEQKKAKMADIKKLHDAEVKGVLNADQYAKLTEMKKQHQGKMQGEKGVHKGKGKKQGDAQTAPKSN
jgi:periplasmic protein CpxP/Spy